MLFRSTDLENAQQIHKMFVSVEKRYPGTVYHVKLQMSAIRKNFARENCFSSFSCKALHNSYQHFMLNGSNFILFIYGT